MLLVAGQIAGLAMRWSTREWREFAGRMDESGTFKYQPVTRAVASMRVLLDAKCTEGIPPPAKQ